MLCIGIVLFSLLNSPLVSTEEGAPCTINTMAEEGICKLVSDCPYAQDLLRQKVYPQICSFAGKMPIVCCKLAPQIQNTTASNLPPKFRPSNLGSTESSFSRPALLQQKPIVVQTVGELTNNKCLSYYPIPSRPIFVTGGELSLAKEFPHMAIIGYGKKDNIKWQCGGSLISKKFVLTAAHCLSSRFGDAEYVRLGDLDLSTDQDDASPQDFTVIRRIPHPSFKPPVRYHDIALLELDREVTLSFHVSPACLHTERELNETTLTATGWGDTNFGGNSSSYLLKVNLNYIPISECIKAFGQTSKILLPNGIDDDSQICAGGNIAKDTCQGDSGGPLQVKNPERSFSVKVHNLIGITSFGKACGLSKSPGIYTRISNYISWIESFAWKNETGKQWLPL